MSNPSPGIETTLFGTPGLEMLKAYPRIADAYDEILTAGGEIRPPWNRLLQGIDHLGTETIRRRWDAAQRVIHENGVTYNVHSDGQGKHRPWALDPIPLIVSAAEWSELATGLEQRARLLNAVLGDLYGPSELLSRRSLPSDLVFANPNFLRPCVGIKPAGGQHLTLAAFDLARNPDGRWWVVNDRTQAPSGTGYALENRLIVSRVLPDLFRDCGVGRLAKFFAQLRDTLIGMSPRQTASPRIAVLTPGPHTESYFEHAYLARYLGFVLVEAGDLTVRDHKVYLKTLGGLEQIDVILRRTDDSLCDPLELRGESVVGVPSLVQAAAAGQVAIANALGTGLIETHSIMPFLPALCREILDESLRLPSVATWWCGQPQELNHVLENLPNLIIKAAFAGDPMPPVFGAFLSPAQAETLRQDILKRPHRYVGQESVGLSTAPAWRDDQLRPRHFMLRAYAVADGRGGYQVMPGGLARVSAEQDSMIVTMQHGGGSKDVWVLSDHPVDKFTLLPSAPEPVAISRSGQELPSRVADGMYWLGRYVERADNLTQLLRAIFIRLTEETSPYGSPELPRLFEALTAMIHFEPEPGLAADPLNSPSVATGFLASVVLDRDQPGSLMSCVAGVQQLGSVVRDRISLDAWRILRSLEETLHPAGLDRNDPTALLGVLDDVVVPLSAFAGLTNESMTHAHGWRFLDLGRRVERGMGLCVLLKHLAAVADDNEPLTLNALLSIACSEMTYRSRYRARVAAGPAIDLLLLDENNPRGLAFQLDRIQSHLLPLPQPAAGPEPVPEQQLIAGMQNLLRVAEVEVLEAPGSGGRRDRLVELIDTFEEQLPVFSDLIVQHYLAHTLSTQNLLPVDATEQASREATL